MIFVFLCLPYCTQYNHLYVHPRCCKWHYFDLSYGWVIVHYIHGPCILYLFLCHWTFRLPLCLGNYELCGCGHWVHEHRCKNPQPNTSKLKLTFKSVKDLGRKWVSWGGKAHEPPANSQYVSCADRLRRAWVGEEHMEIWLSCSHLALLWILNHTGDLGLKFQIWKNMEKHGKWEQPRKTIERYSWEVLEIDLLMGWGRGKALRHLQVKCF